MLNLQSELALIGFLSRKEVSAFGLAKITTVQELLYYFPKRYEDRRRFDCFPLEASNQDVCLRGRVTKAAVKYNGSHRSFFEAVIVNRAGGFFDTGKITIRWFNIPCGSVLIAAGVEGIFYGKIREFKGSLFMDQPEFEVLSNGETDSIHLGRIVPIYRNIVGMSRRRIRNTIFRVISRVRPKVSSMDQQMPDFSIGPGDFATIHFPENMEDVQSIRRRFAMVEFFALQLNVVWRRSVQALKAGRVMGNTTTQLTVFQATLPFKLTGAQERSIREIVTDMRKPRPMNRLLLGDVGSGKTVVALSAMLVAIESGSQAALMAPTLILAEQHYRTFRRLLEPLGIRIALRTGTREEINHAEILGNPQIIIGTHALLYGDGNFQDLGLVVIDEQHKFGVAQRASLISRGTVPDVLVMTATPIPRTLAMTAYGDLDVSLLDEKPRGRGKVITAVRVSPKQSDVTKFLKSQLSLGLQAYLVYPFVEESGISPVGSAIEASVKWEKCLGAKFTVGLIHGRLRQEEKEAVMRQFRDGQISALVSTSVIEVGLDVPNASVMVIHHAERFGLAQLHQLRGRIGRGEHKGYCVLLTDSKSAEAMDKLKVLEKTTDGFEIAEADLRLRGPGDVLGTMQSGLKDLRFPEFLADTTLLRHARHLAENVISRDPQLNNEHRDLRNLIKDADVSDPLSALDHSTFDNTVDGTR